MPLKATFFGIALLGAISPSLAEQVDDSTKCAVVKAAMDDPSSGRRTQGFGEFVEQTVRAADRAYGIKGKTEMLPRLAAGMGHYLWVDTLAGCQDHPDATVKEMTIESYERFRLFIETGVRPPERESLRPINVEMRIVSVEAVTKREATDIGWFDDDYKLPRAMIKVTLATPVNLSELARRRAFDFSAGASICRDGLSDEARRLRPSVFFDNEGVVNAGRHKQTASKESYTYRLYFQLRESFPPDDDRFGKPPYSYDLSKDPQDICLRLGGASEVGYRVNINSLQISSATLREAIKARK